jgi:hypothetical protein
MSDMDQVMRDYYERAHAEREAARQRFIDACNKHGVAKVEIEFDGCGDEGSTHMATPHDEGVEDAAEDYAYFMLEEHFPGWEINDGSAGAIRVDVAAGKLDISFGSRYTDIEWSTKEVSL